MKDSQAGVRTKTSVSMCLTVATKACAHLCPSYSVDYLLLLSKSADETLRPGRLNAKDMSDVIMAIVNEPDRMLSTVRTPESSLARPSARRHVIRPTADSANWGASKV